jgi:hypothetical protein
MSDEKKIFIKIIKKKDSEEIKEEINLNEDKNSQRKTSLRVIKEVPIKKVVIPRLNSIQGLNSSNVVTSPRRIKVKKNKIDEVTDSTENSKDIGTENSKDIETDQDVLTQDNLSIKDNTSTQDTLTQDTSTTLDNITSTTPDTLITKKDLNNNIEEKNKKKKFIRTNMSEEKLKFFENETKKLNEENNIIFEKIESLKIENIELKEKFVNFNEESLDKIKFLELSIKKLQKG